MPAEDRAGERRADEARFRLRVVQPAYLERDQSLRAKIDRLRDALFGEIPEVNTVAVLAVCHILEIETVLEGVRRAPFARDHRVLARLVPEIVVELRATQIVLPAAEDVEGVR